MLLLPPPHHFTAVGGSVLDHCRCRGCCWALSFLPLTLPPPPPLYHSGERGRARPEVLQGLLGTCERVVQEVDSVEYGLTDIQVWWWWGGG